MAKTDLALISRQLLLLQATADALRREQARTADNVEVLKADVLNLRADMRAGFALLDSRLRAFEGNEESS